jgi:hypothetical protein
MHRNWQGSTHIVRAGEVRVVALVTMEVDCLDSRTNRRRTVVSRDFVSGRNLTEVNATMTRRQNESGGRLKSFRLQAINWEAEIRGLQNASTTSGWGRRL